MRDPSEIVQELEVTEKGTDLAAQHNQYLLKVSRSANKIEIKRAVETLFGVGVTAVRTMNYTGKRKRERTAKYGKRADWKRAIVTLKAGDSLDVT